MFALLIIFIGFMMFSTANWIVRKFGEVTYEQIIFHLNMPFSSETRIMLSFFKNTVMTGAIIVLILTLVFCYRYKFHIKLIDKFREFVYQKRNILSYLWLAFCIIFVFYFKLKIYIKEFNQKYNNYRNNKWTIIYYHKFRITYKYYNY